MIDYDIAVRLGLKKYCRSWRGPCPACAYPNAFSLRFCRNGHPRFFCASCRDAQAIARAVTQTLGERRWAEPPGVPDGDATQRRQDAALRLWRGSEPARGTLADTYLTRRSLPDLAESDGLRFRPDARHPEGGRYPALIAAVSDGAGAVIGVHRTFLSPDGRKADVEPSKASLGPFWGGAIRSYPIDPGKPLVIGEGIETAASAGRLMGLPAWAAICAGNLAKGLVLPPEAAHVIIAADPDEPGRKAAWEAWRRWSAEGREVRIATPTGPGDFNDVLMAREAGRAG